MMKEQEDLTPGLHVVILDNYILYPARLYFSTKHISGIIRYGAAHICINFLRKVGNDAIQNAKKI